MRNTLIILVLAMASCMPKRAYVFTSFHEPAHEGLRMLYSYNGYEWKEMDTVLLKPTIGQQKVMRDPSIARGPDGIFHLVWTSSWRGDKGFGYASSRDLIHWSEQRLIPVMKDEPSVVNVWAPEIFYDSDHQRFLVIWASCIPGRFERGIEEDSNNHRLYMTATKDFIDFSPAKLFFDPGFSVIDGVIVKKTKNDFVLVVKDNTRPERTIKTAFASTAEGPYTGIATAFTDKLTEGPTVVNVKDDWLVYYDAYGRHTYDAVKTKDFSVFSSARQLISIPEGHKHGTILPVTKGFLKHFIKRTHSRP